MGVSLNAPAVQAIRDTQQAVETACRANDVLAEEVRRRSDRFCGFAALPMQDPEAAIAEMNRAIVQLGFKGVLVNGFSECSEDGKALYYDRPEYRAFWAKLQDLDVPFYLHPRNPLPRWFENFGGEQWLLGPTWAFGAETAVHALKLIGSGLFDQYPRLNIILGHLGEGIPPMLWRMDNYSKWMKYGPKNKATKPLSFYIRRNFYITTSGNLYKPTLDIVLREVGPDRVMFSIDYPFEDIGQSAEWFESLEISDADKAKIGRDNAKALLRV